MPNLNKDQRKETTTATTKRNDDSKEGQIRESVKVILVKLDAVWLWKRKITHPVLLNNFYVHTHKKKIKKKKSLRFNASDSSYSTQKQTRIMAPFASHYWSVSKHTRTLFLGHDALKVKAARAVRAARNGAMTGESCQPCNLTRVNKFWFDFEVPRDACFFSTFYVCFIFMFSLRDALGLITFAFIS